VTSDEFADETEFREQVYSQTGVWSRAMAIRVVISLLAYAPDIAPLHLLEDGRRQWARHPVALGSPAGFSGGRAGKLRQPTI
jgi:hypothetical protein